MKRMVSLGAGVLALAACQPDMVNDPTEAALVETQLTGPAVMNVDLSALGATLDDAMLRLAPALEDKATALQIGAQLERLSRALAAGNAADLPQALAEARAVLGGAAETPNGAAIGLALDRVEALLSVSEATRPVDAATGRDGRS